MSDAEKLAQVRKALGFDSGLDAHDNLLGASMDIEANDEHLADDVCRTTIMRVLGQLLEARQILLGTQP